MEKRIFVIRGEDMRNIYLARMLLRDGYKAALWEYPAQYQDIPSIDTESISVSPCVLVVPLVISQEELLKALRSLAEGSVCFGGYVGQEVLEYVNTHKIEYYNILEHVAFPILNSIPTAEGALMVAMQNTPYTIHGSKTIVLGYGKVGKSVAELFHSCSSEVTVAARSEEALAYAQAYGYRCIRLSDLGSTIHGADIILNTIPALILDKNLLSKVKTDALIIELASGKNNIDYTEAQQFGITVIQAPALPAKVAPASAAQYVKETIQYYLKN